MKRLLLMTGVMAVVLGTATVLHAKEITVRGKLQKTVEAGGWLIVNGDTKYLILNSRRLSRSTRGLRSRQTSKLSAKPKT